MYNSRLLWSSSTAEQPLLQLGHFPGHTPLSPAPGARQVARRAVSRPLPHLGHVLGYAVIEGGQVLDLLEVLVLALQPQAEAVRSCQVLQGGRWRQHSAVLDLFVLELQGCRV